ncbi:tetratricopeptide repeat protein [Comamonas avium]|nr:tetratricopeptide repeat protein [Comamonas avium]
MQSESIKKRIIKSLIDEIVSIDATSLELFGHRLLELIEKKKLIHHGLNKDHRPVGYTVDTFSQSSDVIGEYSAEKTYFVNASKEYETPCFPKVANDIDHALSHGNPKKIYLIASQEEKESFRAKFLKSDHGQKYANLVEILDARELAKRIYEFSVANPSDGAFFGDFFPDFAKNLENYEYYGRIPSRCENHQSDDLVLSAVQKQFESGTGVCVLHGLSGSGKTQAAIDYVRQNVDRIGNYIWIYGDDFKKGTTLSSIKRSRGGTPFNVAGAFNSCPTLLVIDNLDWAVDESTFEELKLGLAAGGLILVTSTLNLPGQSYYVATPSLSFETAVKVLGEDISKLSELARCYVEACRFSPLILATTRSICKVNGIDKESFYKEVLEKPDLLSSQDGTSILREVLSRLDTHSQEALVMIANSTSGTHDARFLGAFITQTASINLQRLSILQSATTPGLLKVHDLICDAVRTTPDAQPVSDAIERFVAEGSGEMLTSAIRQIHLCEKQLMATHRARSTRQPDWLMYALMQAGGDARSEIAAKLHGLKITGKCSLAEVLCIVDAKEDFAYTIADNVAREAYYKQCADEYQSVIDSGVRDELKVELLHHRGKALRRSGSAAEALSSFQEILAYRSEWHAAHGQIAHLGTQKEANDQMKAAGEASMIWLVERILSGYSAVPLRVSLAAIARLRSYPKVISAISAEPEKVKQLSDVIAIAALDGLDQFYEAFLAFTSKFGYEHIDVTIALAGAMPELLTVPPESIDTKQWTSACEALSNTAQSAKSVGKAKLANRLIASATIFAQALVNAGELKPFSVRAVMKAFLAADMPDRALDICEQFAPKTKDHWLLYRKSQALLELGNTQPALDVALEALKVAKQDSKAEDRIASYYELLSKCAEAIPDISTAIAYCQDATRSGAGGKYMQQLKERLSRLKAAAAQVQPGT